ncbi:MAG: aldehyde dehydrogenase family protein, partial [Leptolyngbyaceae cyanobacterium CAN_BIN12]|nr:aldehyde dehydrogenase family protein [Leptolyngbyaceae cyanobacterium CAN_BIN12]
MSIILQNYVNGEWVSSNTTDYLDVINPATVEVLAQVPLSEARDVDQAVQAAQQAFTTWRRVPAGDRIQYLFKLKILLEEHLDDLAQT